MKSSVALAIALPLAFAFASGCASTSAVAPAVQHQAQGQTPAQPQAQAQASVETRSWSNVQKLSEGDAVRVTQKDGERYFGHVMAVSSLEIKLELVDASKSIARDDVRLIERFPRSFPRSLPGAAVGVGAALSLASSSTPEGYYESVAPASENLDKASAHVNDGYYVNAVELVGASVDRIANAIEASRRTVVVYEIP